MNGGFCCTLYIIRCRVKIECHLSNYPRLVSQSLRWLDDFLVTFFVFVRLKRRSVAWSFLIISLATIRLPRAHSNSFWTRFNSHNCTKLELHSLFPDSSVHYPLLYSGVMESWMRSHFFLLFVFVWARALAATLFDVLLYLLSRKISDAFVATLLEVCLLFPINFPPFSTS